MNNLQQEIDLVLLAKEDNSAKELLYEKYEKLILKLVQKYKATGIEFEDLKSEAYIGFLYAIEKYDPTKNVKFDTYAFNWIRERILLYIKNNHRKVSIAYNKLNKLQKIRKIVSQLETQNYEEEVIDEVICMTLKITKNELIEYKSLMQPILSLDTSSVIENADRNEISDSIEKKYIKEQLLASILLLSLEERNIIILYYYKDCKMKEIKEITKYSTAKINKLRKIALEKMKEYLIEAGIDYTE